MNRRKQAHQRLWIQDRDSRGHEIDRRLKEAAEQIWEPARLAVIRFLADDAEAPEILESVVDSASRLMNEGRTIEVFQAYLLKAVAREAIRRLTKSRRIVYMDAAHLERIAGATSIDIESELDDAKRIETFRAWLDPQGRKIYDLRVLGFTWPEIAQLMGYSDRHSAEVQFRKRVDRASKRFVAHQRMHLKGKPSV